MNGKDRVLHVISGLTTGGAETALFNLLDGGLADRFDNRVISLRDLGSVGPKIQTLGVPVANIGIRGGFPTFGNLKKMRREIESFQPDLIQGWMYHGNLAAAYMARLGSTPPALAWNVRHSLYDLKSEKRMTRQVIQASRLISRKPDLILYNSELSRRQHEAFGFQATQGHVIPNGINLDRYQPSYRAKEVVMRELGIPDGFRIVCHLARFHPMKNHIGFIRAAVRVCMDLEDIHFVLCGKGIDSTNRALIRCVPKTLRDRFHWLGERDDVPELLHGADLVCQSSIWGEGFPNVLGEAMAAGIPCVATDVGDSAAIIGDTGLIVPPSDDDALATAVKSILEMSASDRIALGVAARARIAERYSLPAIVQRYAAEYEKMVAERNVVIQ